MHGNFARGLLAFGALILLLGNTPSAHAQYNFTTIDAPGSTSTAANGNSTNAIAGEFTDTNDATHGFILSKGVFTTVDVPGADVTNVGGINASGQIAGFYVDGSGFHGYVRREGVVTTLDPIGSIRTIAFFLNARASRGSVPGRQPDTPWFCLE